MMTFRNFFLTKSHLHFLNQTLKRFFYIEKQIKNQNLKCARDHY